MVQKKLTLYENGIHKFVVEYLYEKSCDILGWKKRLMIALKDVRNYFSTRCKFNSQCEVSSTSCLNVKNPYITSSSVGLPKNSC